MNNADKPAFPEITTEYNEYRSEWVDVKKPGMTKREYFAAMAMQGILANPNRINKLNYAAEESVNEADALIRKLES